MIVITQNDHCKNGSPTVGHADREIHHAPVSELKKENYLLGSTSIPSSTQEKSRMSPWTLAEPAQISAANPVSLAILIDDFSPITLSEMDAVALLNRIDTKLAMPVCQIFNILASLKKDYRILSVCGQRLNHYRNLYFDTPDFDLYHLHVNGYANRYKVRSREYAASCLSFLEVKHRTPKGRTIKTCISSALPVTRLNGETENWPQDVFP